MMSKRMVLVLFSGWPVDAVLALPLAGIAPSG